MPFQCEKHTAVITDRGGQNVLGYVEPLNAVHYGRVRDEISEGWVRIVQPTKECYSLFNEVSANRHELVIYRGAERVWEGPIIRIERHSGHINVVARDVMHYAYRTVCHNEYDNSQYWVDLPGDGLGDADSDNNVNDQWVDNSVPCVDRAYTILTTELNRKKETLSPPINVVAHMVKRRYKDTAKERRSYRKTLAYTQTVYDDIESMATHGGLDYTVVGRNIILFDNRLPIGMTEPITERDIIGELVVTSYGMESFTRVFTVGDDGMYGEAGGVHEFYGEWEDCEQMFDEDSEVPPSQEALTNAAAYALQGALPVPTRVRLPENTTLNPDGVLSLKDMVPGVYIPVHATLPSMDLTQVLKLDSVTVEETEGGEVISISAVQPPQSEFEDRTPVTSASGSGDWVDNGDYDEDAFHKMRLNWEIKPTPTTVKSSTVTVDLRLRIYFEAQWSTLDQVNSLVLTGDWGSTTIQQKIALGPGGGITKIFDKTISVPVGPSSVGKTFTASLSDISNIPGAATCSGNYVVPAAP